MGTSVSLCSTAYCPSSYDPAGMAHYRPPLDCLLMVHHCTLIASSSPSSTTYTQGPASSTIVRSFLTDHNATQTAHFTNAFICYQALSTGSTRISTAWRQITFSSTPCIAGWRSWSWRAWGWRRLSRQGLTLAHFSAQRKHILWGTLGA
jgi:hypothetical protein